MKFLQHLEGGKKFNKDLTHTTGERKPASDICLTEDDFDGQPSNWTRNYKGKFPQKAEGIRYESSSRQRVQIDWRNEWK